MRYRLFADESCHLEHDGIPVMCIGYIKVPDVAYAQLKETWQKIALKHKTPGELKWNKVSASRMPFYKEIIDFFFDVPLEFRCILIKYKDRLKHDDFNSGSHANFYYKMMYFLLKPNPIGVQYNVFIDIKDTRGRNKLQKLQQVFESYHRGNSPFESLQHIRSQESVFIQLTDLFIGAITYKARGLDRSTVKKELVNYIEEKSGLSLDEGTTPWESKFNIFDYQPRKREG